MAGFLLRGTVLPEGVSRQLHVDAAGLVSAEPVAGAQVIDCGWIVPGLVDAHCHIGLGPEGAVELGEAAEQAVTDRRAGTLLIRDCGSPVDTRPLQARDDLPEIIRAGRHLARPRRYVPTVALDAEPPEVLADLVVEQVAAGDGWVKLVGDWIDRSVGDLAPLWPDEVAKAAIDAAHAAGARVTAHVFGTDALPALISAGIDCIEHGTGLTDELIVEMAARGTALVPTLINIDTFPSIAERAARYPLYAAHMRELHRTSRETIGRAIEAGVPVYAGTDAGGGIRHGRIADEVAALAAAGHPDALGAASWAAREWLGRPGLEPGAPANLVAYPEDPRRDPAVLRHTTLMVLRGRLMR